MEILLQHRLQDWHPLLASVPTGMTPAVLLAAVIWMIGGAALWRRMLLFVTAVFVAGLLVAQAMADGGTGGVLAPARVPVAGVALLALLGVSFWLERRTTIERNPKDPLPVRLVVGGAAVAAALLAALTAYVSALAP